MSSLSFESLLSDSNQRPRDYKSRALANWAKEAGGKANHIALLQLTTFAAIKPWRIRKELAVWHFPMWWDAFLLVCTAKERFYFDSTKFRRIFLSTFHEKTSLSPFSRPFLALHCAQLRFIFHAPPPFASPTVGWSIPLLSSLRAVMTPQPLPFIFPDAGLTPSASKQKKETKTDI